MFKRGMRSKAASRRERSGIPRTIRSSQPGAPSPGSPRNMQARLWVVMKSLSRRNSSRVITILSSGNSWVLSADSSATSPRRATSPTTTFPSTKGSFSEASTRCAPGPGAMWARPTNTGMWSAVSPTPSPTWNCSFPYPRNTACEAWCSSMQVTLTVT